MPANKRPNRYSFACLLAEALEYPSYLVEDVCSIPPTREEAAKIAREARLKAAEQTAALEKESEADAPPDENDGMFYYHSN
jgi:hypothetical protein